MVDRMDDVIEIEDLSAFVKTLQVSWGKNSDITIHIWRANWQS
jgi:hypothetical protein